MGEKFDLYFNSCDLRTSRKARMNRERILDAVFKVAIIQYKSPTSVIVSKSYQRTGWRKRNVVAPNFFKILKKIALDFSTNIARPCTISAPLLYDGVVL